MESTAELISRDEERKPGGRWTKIIASAILSFYLIVGVGLFNRSAQTSYGISRNRYAFGHSESLMSLGIRRVEEGDMSADRPLREALSQLEKLSAPGVDDSERKFRIAICHNYLGIAALQLGRLRDAQDEFENALETLDSIEDGKTQRTDLVVAMKDVILNIIYISEDDMKVRSLANRLLALDPREPAAWWAMGLAEYHAGSYGLAVENFQRSMELGWEDDTYLLFHMSMAHALQGDHARARDWYLRAIERMDAGGDVDQDLINLRAEAAALVGTP